MLAKNYGLAQNGWPFLFVIEDTQHLPYFSINNSADVDELHAWHLAVLIACIMNLHELQRIRIDLTVHCIVFAYVQVNKNGN
jgi:glycogen synthase